MKSDISAGKSPLAYREKRAWLSLAAMALAFIPYFALTAAARPAALPGLHQLALFAAAVVVQVAVLAAGSAYFRLTGGAAAERPDERDREIERRAVTYAYYVLIAGIIVVGFIMPFKTGGWAIVNAALISVIVAEIVHYVSIGVSYRRQS